MIFKGKRILVTGGTGSMGKTFVRRVLRGELGMPRPGAPRSNVPLVRLLVFCLRERRSGGPVTTARKLDIHGATSPRLRAERGDGCRVRSSSVSTVRALTPVYRTVESRSR